VGARRFGYDELKRWPALLQCLLGLQCQSGPGAAHIRENGLQARIWRVCAHPLTVSGPKPALKWSKHRRPPRCGEQSDPGDQTGPGKETLSRRYSAPHARFCPKLDAPSVRYSTQHNSILSGCCSDHTHFGVFRELGRLGRRGRTEFSRYRTVRICYADTVRPSDYPLHRAPLPRGAFSFSINRRPCPAC
jgi:hypothetical protein